MQDLLTFAMLLVLSSAAVIVGATWGHRSEQRALNQKFKTKGQE